MKVKNDWYKKFYDDAMASLTLDSRYKMDEAKKEVDFIFKKVPLKKGCLVLDVPCGAGRHSILMAKRGLKVTGIDISPASIRLARKKRHKNLEFLIGNMSDLKDLKGRFDLVTNLFTSFGYFPTDRENENVMLQMASALKPGGKLVICLLDKDHFLNDLKEKDWLETNKWMFCEKNEYDKKSGYVYLEVVLITKNDGKFRKYRAKHKLYGIKEMKGLMKKCGFKKVDVYGGMDGSRFLKGISHHPVYIATK